MHGRSYKNRCWKCLCKSFAQKLYKMEPGSAARSKCEPLLSVFEGSGVPSANEELRFGIDLEKWRAIGVAKTFENAW